MSHSRPGEEVLADHLARRARGDIEGDLEQNYAPDVVLLCEHGAFAGREAVRDSAEALARQLGDAPHQICASTAAANMR